MSQLKILITGFILLCFHSSHSFASSMNRFDQEVLKFQNQISGSQKSSEKIQKLEEFKNHLMAVIEKTPDPLSRKENQEYARMNEIGMVILTIHLNERNFASSCHESEVKIRREGALPHQKLTESAKIGLNLLQEICKK